VILGLSLGIIGGLLPLSWVVILLGGVILLLAFYAEPALALVFMLCVAPLKTLIETESTLRLPLDVGQVALGVFIGFWVLRYVVDGKPPLYFSPALLSGISIFMLGASLSLWTAYSTLAVLTELVKWVQMLLLVILVNNLPRWEWALGGIILSTGLQAVIGVWEFLGGSGAAHLWILDYRFFRAFGTFGQPNPFGAFMGMVLPLVLGTALGYLWNARIARRREALWIGLSLAGFAGLIGLGLLASWSRGAWLGCLAGITVVVWSLPRPRWIGTAIVILGMIGMALLILTGAMPQSLSDRLVGFTEDFAGFRDVRGVVINDDNFAVTERLAHWQAAIEMARTSPWIGIGFGNYETTYPNFALINWNHALGHAHNYYLNLLAETGMIGLIAYLVMWGTIFILNGRLLSQVQDWRGRGIAAGLLGTWTYIAVHSLLDKMYVNNLFLHIGVMLGILAVLWRGNDPIYKYR
jgi:O-antigen ligase